MQGSLTRRQALAAGAAAAGAAAIGRPAGAAAHGGGGDHGRERQPEPDRAAADPHRRAAARPGQRRGDRAHHDRVREGDRAARRAAGTTGRPGDRRRRRVRVARVDRRPRARGHRRRGAVGDVAKGATTVRSASTSFFQDVGLRAMGEYGGLGIPRVLPAGLVRDAEPRRQPARRPAPRAAGGAPDGVRSPEALRFLTQVNISRGAEVIKTRSTERAGLPEQDPRQQVYDERQLRAVVDAARRLPGGVLAHGHGDEGRARLGPGRGALGRARHLRLGGDARPHARAAHVPDPDGLRDHRHHRAGRGVHRPAAGPARARHARRAAGDGRRRLRAGRPDRRGHRHVLHGRFALERRDRDQATSRTSG